MIAIASLIQCLLQAKVQPGHKKPRLGRLFHKSHYRSEEVPAQRGTKDVECSAEKAQDSFRHEHPNPNTLSNLHLVPVLAFKGDFDALGRLDIPRRLRVI